MVERINLAELKAQTKKRLLRQLDEFDSEAERDWNRTGKIWLSIQLGCSQKMWVRHHPFTLHLIGESYSPDFLMIPSDTGDQCVIEVKGSRQQKNYRDARSKLRSAAKMFPMFRFFQAMQTREQGWIIEEIT